MNFRYLPILCLLLFVLTSSKSNAQNGRSSIDFNSNWKFKKSADTANKSVNWLNITLPHTWNDTDMQLGKNFYEGEALYGKEFLFEPQLKNKRIFIRFEGVGQVAELYINNKLIGSHQGSYSAFCFDISHAVILGKKNNFLVKVSNKARRDIIPVNHFLFGIYGGIYRPVSLIITNPINITTTDYASSGIYISQKEVSHTAASISITAKVENTTGQPANIEIKNTVYRQNGSVYYEKASAYKLSTLGRQELTQNFTLNNPILWEGINYPYLYKVITQILQEGKIIDEVIQPLGIRKFEMVAGKGMFLNHKPYPMYGVCRHQDRWQYGNALSNGQHQEDLAIIKEMGTTTLRLAHYQQAEYMYAKSDSLGFMVWAEIPFVNTFTREEAANAKQQLEELIKQNYNHPSIYIWGLHNEVYGKTPADYPAVLTRDLNDLAKRIDPYRYTVAVSGYGEMERPTNLNTDIQGMNRYYGWYESKINDLEKWAKNLKKDYPDDIVILSEYGADGNILQQQEQSTLPENWDYSSPIYPENFETKTHEQQWAIIAKNPYITASYVWNMFDFATPMWNRGSLVARNMKGLVSFDRVLKKDVFYWYKANWSKEPVVYLTERRTIKRKNALTPVTVYSNQGEPSLYLNGKKLNIRSVVKGTAVHYVFENVKLKKGKNKIKTIVKNKDQRYSDELIWELI
ncbi:glycoside hydrolase family 2 protein [Pedobacter sp. ASV28]|uniref:glycoside hydrolase family 2 protein n=1 Tax=Pedobacter sp. ASV28 TaxID=2795123 RepID=UPI0018EAF3B1|nr:glycoside hydrolase family 2 TIM barrel-domain containing protein [Pedobacter sp. ASV28]